MRFLRTLLFFVIVGGVAVAALALWKGAGPLPDPEGCTASVNGHVVGIDPEQGQNASLIAAIGVRRGLPARAVSIALATAFQESKLRNLPHGDRDSIGLFQQRPSQGWGTVAQISDPYYSTNAFYDALVKINGYESMRITEAAQKVQRSGFPEAYEDHAPDGRALASALTGYSGGGRFSCVVHASSTRGTADEVSTSVRKAFGPLAVVRDARQNLHVNLPAGAAGARLGWSTAQFLVAHAGDLHIRSVAYDGRVWKVGRESEKGWVRGGGGGRKVSVNLG